MAAHKVAQPSKRPRRNRKSRTDVSSPRESSSSDSDSASSPINLPKQEKAPRATKQASASPSPDVAANRQSQSASPPDQSVQQQATAPPQQSFEQLYLSQATKEFANDLDKLRNAGDFRGGQSVEVLVRALRQGTGCFEDEEKGRVGAGG